MEEFIVNAIDSLAKALKADPRIKKLDAIEAKLSSSSDLVEKEKRLRAEEESYSFCLSYSKNDKKKLESAEKSLYLAKKNLDEDPLAIEYSDAYIAVRDLYMEIDDIIFSPFRKKSLTGESE